MRTENETGTSTRDGAGIRNWFEGYFFGGGGVVRGIGFAGDYGLMDSGFLGGRFELTEDGDIDIVIEPGIGFESGFGGGIAFDNGEIMAEEADFPRKGFRGTGLFEVVGEALSGFDAVTVRYAGFGVMGREMISV